MFATIDGRVERIWLEEIQTYNVSTNTMFQLCVAIMWTINNFPTNGNISSWSTRRKMACPACDKDASHVSMQSKRGYIRHRSYFPKNHARCQDMEFDGT